MQIDIISPSKILYSGKIELVKLPGEAGYFEIKKNHAPIVSTLKSGEIKVKDENGRLSHFKIESGLVEASHNQISVLVETA